MELLKYQLLQVIPLLCRTFYEESLVKGMAAINKSLGKMVSKGKMTQETADDTVSKISTTLSLEEAVKDADFVIEAVPEELKLKLETYKRLSSACKKDCILGSNTSTLPITILASVVENPERVAGVHFMNPVPVIK
jgi:3-hydroxybutyryl-CoA dehydrogenase